jgi:predicted 3-demethylubiquinone-9 3-methyltransferase (glyoxalase superfamily)
MTTRIRPFLLFEGKAAQAMAFYVAPFPGAEIIETVSLPSQPASNTVLQ